MRQRHFGLILFAGMLLGMLFSTSANAQVELNDMDSFWVNIENYSTAEANDMLTMTFNWETYHRPYNQKKRSFTSEWGKFDKADQLTFRVILSTDSLFSVITKTQDVQGKEATFTDLEFGTKYYAKVEPIGVTNEFKALASEGVIFKNSNASAKGDMNMLQSFWKFSVDGGILMPFIYAFALFGFLVAMPITWWKLRIANIFPPNKSGFIYSILPFDVSGKTDFMTDKGNAYIREIVKYWGKAMEAQNMKPSLWKDEDQYIKSSMQEQEEMKKKLWLKVGLPNIEKAIEICKNGVPGVKYAKKPIEYPFARVFIAVLENHRANKNNWWTSQEMDRAMSNTSSKELDALSGWTINALWAIGSIEPMMGLFGTVMGIRGAFMTITDVIRENPNAELTTIVPQLAEGIHVALITTITGLAFGVPFTLAYYYYKGKVNWVAGKWEEIIVDVLNRA